MSLFSYSRGTVGQAVIARKHWAFEGGLKGRPRSSWDSRQEDLQAGCQKSGELGGDLDCNSRRTAERIDSQASFNNSQISPT